MTILITGASGLIGSHLCKRLVESGADIVALTHKATNLVLASIPQGDIKIIAGDVCDYANLNLIFSYYQPATVFHLAAALPYDADPKYFEVNITGSSNILSLSKEHGIRQFIFASSMSVYATPQYLPVDENHPVAPANVYGSNKLYVERMIPEYGIPFTIIRYSGVYGVGQKKGRAIGTFVKQALNNKPIVVNGDGSQSSDFISVHDAVDGTVKAWGKQGTFNIGSGQEVGLLELARLIIKLTKSKSEIIVDGLDAKPVDRPFRFVADISKARRELGFNPSGIKDGLKRYISEVSVLESCE